MKISQKASLCSYLGMTAAAFLFVSVAVAQTSDSKTATPTTKAATPAKPTTPTAHVDQWPKASGQAADAKNSGHASESLSAPAAASQTHETVEYKDPEDMTTRYRPGNNKTTGAPAASPSTLPATPPTGQAPTDTIAKKHIAGVKYEDRQAGFPACDGASKDAAKCAVAPAATPASGKGSAPAAQESKRKNSIDSVTVKQ